jgi:uncharacterized protein YbcI
MAEGSVATTSTYEADDGRTTVWGGIFAAAPYASGRLRLPLAMDADRQALASIGHASSRWAIDRGRSAGKRCPAERFSSVFSLALSRAVPQGLKTRREPAMSGTTELPRTEQSASAKISNLVVQILRTYTGRGPTKAWTSIDEDLISVVLRDQLSRGELSLITDDRKQLVLEMRQAYQQTMAPDMVAGIEKITGRTVVAFMSANHLEPDIGIESFVLEPRSSLNGADGRPPD